MTQETEQQVVIIDGISIRNISEASLLTEEGFISVEELQEVEKSLSPVKTVRKNLFQEIKLRLLLPMSRK